ncbi:MAG: hypothetical protein M1840_007386 [Geoglossum simile]|nr:MAG: hypothetical protein M1840_007386 [Geoglossum simile]
MPRSTKRLASSESTLDASEVVEHIRFNRKSGRGKSRGYINQNESLRQQTLTQIDFVSYISMEEADLNPIEDEEPLGSHLEEDSAKVEQANAKTSANIAPLTVPTTPRKKRKLEIPSSHSPPDSPYSPDSKETRRKPVSPLATRAQQLTKSSSLETNLGVKPPQTLVAGGSIFREIGGIGDNIPLPVPSLSDCQDISKGGGVVSPASACCVAVEAVSFEEETGSVTISRTEGSGKADARAKTEIRGSDDEDSETDYDFGPETQVVVDNIDLTCFSESFSDDKTPSPKHTYEVNLDSISKMTSQTDEEELKSSNDGVNKAKQVSFKESTTIEIHGMGSGKSSQTYGHPNTDGCRTEDACIQPEGGNRSNHSQHPPLSEKHTAGFGGTSDNNDVQSTSISPPVHSEAQASRPTSLDIWMDNYTRAGKASEGVYEFESTSQLLPESLMGDSLPLPPGFSREFFDEDDC